MFSRYFDVLCCFKSNTYCVLLGDAQQFFCGFIGNIFMYKILHNQTTLSLCLIYNINFLLNGWINITFATGQCLKNAGKSLHVALQEWLLIGCLKKKSRFREEEKSPTNFQSCYIVMTIYFEDLYRNVWSEDYDICLSNVMKLKL